MYDVYSYYYNKKSDFEYDKQNYVNEKALKDLVVSLDIGTKSDTSVLVSFDGREYTVISKDSFNYMKEKRESFNRYHKAVDECENLIKTYGIEVAKIKVENIYKTAVNLRNNTKNLLLYADMVNYITNKYYKNESVRVSN